MVKVVETASKSDEMWANVVSALSSETRAIVLQELVKAQLDTSVEYHRSSDTSVQQLLWGEVQSLNFGIEIVKNVMKEYEE
jgi:hypothetical protein